MIADNFLKRVVQSLPENPGVYQYFDADKNLIYVGKAKNLKKRVGSYFTKEQEGKTKALVGKIADIKHIVVDTEFDALLLENNLIKKHRPRYNVMLKDDKTYPWICIKNEPFSRIFPTRKQIKDGSQYFGPYPSLRMMNTLLELIRKTYPLRNCKHNLSEKNIAQKKYKVCLEYHIKNCKGPCIGEFSEEEYVQNIAEIKQIIKGKISQLVKELRQQMMDLAKKLQFEEAQIIKEKLKALEGYQSKSAVLSDSFMQEVLEKQKHQNLMDPERHTKRILNRMKDDLALSALPTHIECFDNSNFHGDYAVAAMTVMKNAKLSKKDYRHFNIKTVEGSNDFASMEEVIYRRYSRLLAEIGETKFGESQLPQLIIVDGGKGQLSAATKSLKKLQLSEKIHLIGIAERLEEIYRPGDPYPLHLDKKSETLKIIQQLRDEAHRFGITHYRKKHEKGLIKTELTDIKGIGKTLAVKLLHHFHSVKNIKKSSFEELESVVGTAKAKNIFEYFSPT